MLNTPPELFKSLADRLAQVITSEQGAHTARLLRLTGLLGEGLHQMIDTGTKKVDEPREKSARSTADCVGIWEKKVEGSQTYFARRKDRLKEWTFWANVGRIEAKGTKRRVILIGESVARGYLYDPKFNPAMVLEKVLQARLGKNDIEVIDLARTNLVFEVKELARSALLLEPDAVIIFSGNNWAHRFPQTMASLATAEAHLREHGIAGLKKFAEQQLRENVKEIVGELATVYREKSVPLIWILPEFNLGDWRDPITNAPHLPQNANHEWIMCSQNAWSALQQGDVSTADDLARKLMELDGGTNVTAPYILAECSERLGDIEAKRYYLELAKSAILWENISPRIHNVVLKTMREETARYQNAVVDMPEILKEHLQGQIPDRRIFLDYCHMTTEGIHIAMSAAGSCVLRSLTGANTPWRALMQDCVSPGPEVEAEAAFLAAVHNAHWWQPYEVVHHHCLRAIKASKHIIGIMRNFVDLQTRQAPMLMCREAEEIARLGSLLIHSYLLLFNSQRLDKVLLSAIVDGFEDTGMDEKNRLEQLREQEHSIAQREIDLLSHYYCSAVVQPQELMWLSMGVRGSSLTRPHHYYRAYWPVSGFAFVGGAGCPVHLSLACRLPGASSEDLISIQINGKTIGEILVSGTWETWDIVVEGEFVKGGLNEIKIQWPISAFPGEKAIEGIVDDLIAMTLPDFFPVFGEIHTFTATAAKGVEPAIPAASRQLSAVGAQ